MATITKNRNFFKCPKLLYFQPDSSNLGTFWLKIEQFWPFEEISIFSNGGHRRPVSKMAAMTKNRNFFKCPKLLYFQPESAQI
jgi:hypothetical protein